MSKSAVLFVLTTATIPIQLGTYFFKRFSYVLGIPIDYLAITLYLSDIVLAIYVLASLWENKKNLKKIYHNSKTLVNILLVLNLYLFLTLPFSKNPPLSFWLSLKTLEFSTFAFFARLSFTDKKNITLIKKVILLTLLAESLVIICQFVFQKSLGLQFLGERAFDSSTVGIAQTSVLGHFLVRPYGTFPHPNLAAAFLVVYMLIYFGLGKKLPNLKSTAFLFVSTLAILATFSRTALISIVITAALLIRNKTAVATLIFASATSVLLIVKGLSDAQLSSITERLLLSKIALDTAVDNLAFGVGKGVFISELANYNLTSITQIRLLQPVHNIFMLTLVENGLIGLLLLSALLLYVAKYTETKVKTTLFLVVLTYASLDHFFATLQQGQLLFWLSLSYILSTQKAKNS